MCNHGDKHTSVCKAMQISSPNPPNLSEGGSLLWGATCANNVLIAAYVEVGIHIMMFTILYINVIGTYIYICHCNIYICDNNIYKCG